VHRMTARTKMVVPALALGAALLAGSSILATGADDDADGRELLRARPQVTSLDGYTAMDLGTLGGSWSIAVAINSLGQITGESETSSSHIRAFLWTNGTMTDLGTLGGNSSSPVAMNDSGQVVGWSDTASGQGHAFLWAGGAMTDLGTIASTGSQAVAINRDGHVAGWRLTADGHRRAFVWKGAGPIDIGTLGGLYSEPAAINDAGQVVGVSCTAGAPAIGLGCTDGGERHAFLWDDGVMVDLGTLGGSWSTATALNAAGTVVGGSSTGEYGRRAFLWRDGMMQDLGDLLAVAEALAVNDADQVIGYGLNERGAFRAFFWEDGVAQELGTLDSDSWSDPWSYPTAINRAGQVVGWSGFKGFMRAFLWQSGVMTELGSLGGGEGGALALNDAARVVGWSLDADLRMRATFWQRLSPTDSISDLIAAVAAVADAGGLNAGQARSLTNKLHIATAMLDQGKTLPARRQIEAFIREVQGLVSGGSLSPSEGGLLIQQAQALLGALPSSTSQLSSSDQ
jgi:probable HAF family extracellular repeat protein